MPAEIDFSKGARSHHIPPGAKVFLPVSIELRVWRYYFGKASQKAVALSDLITEVYRFGGSYVLKTAIEAFSSKDSQTRHVSAGTRIIVQPYHGLHDVTKALKDVGESGAIYRIKADSAFGPDDEVLTVSEAQLEIGLGLR
jgi:hypothetical protein